MTDDFPLPDEVQRLKLEPGDVLVLSYDGMLSADQAQHMRAIVEQRFPGHKAMVLTDGMTLSVGHGVETSPDDLPPAPPADAEVRG